MTLEPEWRLEFSSGGIDAHCAPDGPIAAALDWLEKVVEGRLDDAWFSTSALFRLALTRYWCWQQRFVLHQAGHDPVGIAADLAEGDGPMHPLWPAFARSQQLPGSAGPVARGGWVAVGPPEPIGPDLEVVELVLADTIGTDHRCPPLTLQVRLSLTGWQVAGHGRVPMKVGWPPCQR
jgi:hypothetical protein